MELLTVSCVLPDNLILFPVLPLPVYPRSHIVPPPTRTHLLLLLLPLLAAWAP